ncbi:hypothetical protein [Nonomuraea dietziae]
MGRAVKGRREQVALVTKAGGISCSGREGQLDSIRIVVTWHP